MIEKLNILGLEWGFENLINYWVISVDDDFLNLLQILYHCFRKKHGVNANIFLAQLRYTFAHRHSIGMNFEKILVDLLTSLQIIPTISHKNTLALFFGNYNCVSTAPRETSCLEQPAFGQGQPTVHKFIVFRQHISLNLALLHQFLEF